jgi:hypothetical protein
MIEIPIWILFTIAIAALGLGVTIGFKVAEKKPEILESESFCKIAHFSQPTWPKIIFKNGKRVDTNCSLFVSKRQKCVKTNDKCMFFSNIDYDVKYAETIEDLKNKKVNR